MLSKVLDEQTENQWHVPVTVERERAGQGRRRRSGGRMVQGCHSVACGTGWGSQPGPLWEVGESESVVTTEAWSGAVLGTARDTL